jgi:hypothetical protein
MPSVVGPICRLALTSLSLSIPIPRPFAAPPAILRAAPGGRQGGLAFP